MRIHARKIVAIATLFVLGAAPALSAQTSDTVTDVPFAFTIGMTSLPRDTYRVSRLTGHMDVFMISSLRHSAILLSQPDGPSDTDETPRLVFHRYADRYFLREIRLPGNVGFRLPKTRAEREAAEQIAGRSSAEVVVVRADQE